MDKVVSTQTKYTVNSLLDQEQNVLDLSVKPTAVVSNDDDETELGLRCPVSDPQLQLSQLFLSLLQKSRSAPPTNCWLPTKLPGPLFPTQKSLQPPPPSSSDMQLHSLYLQQALLAQSRLPRHSMLDLAGSAAAAHHFQLQSLLCKPLPGPHSLSAIPSSGITSSSIGVASGGSLHHHHHSRKRKRTKVTDTRLPRRNPVLTNFSGFYPGMHHHPHHHAYSYPSSPPMQNSSQHPHQSLSNSLQTAVGNPMSGAANTSGSSFTAFLSPPQTSTSPQSAQSEDLTGDPKKYTLTPIHLRKAKLMFLYTRYPNSQMLKSYFPDITFYKQNTAQLVKWFSNFREFYYSEMEKAVQRAISNGIKVSKDLDVTVDSELFKNLMTHFNKKKQIVVPTEFLATVQITIREFFEAISSGKNLHQSWKKPIYKTIAKLDQPLPEFFKDMNWMMELAKEENDSLHS